MQSSHSWMYLFFQRRATVVSVRSLPPLFLRSAGHCHLPVSLQKPDSLCWRHQGAATQRPGPALPCLRLSALQPNRVPEVCRFSGHLPCSPEAPPGLTVLCMSPSSPCPFFSLLVWAVAMVQSACCKALSPFLPPRLADELSGWVQRHQRGRRKVPQRVQERQVGGRAGPGQAM